jgi:SAM-dependent methyltransferase
VLDVACGVGASTIQVARETGAEAVGVDLSDELLAKARAAAAAGELDGRVRFLEGDAEALPLDDESVDAVLCECALCTFPDKPTAAAEMARVLRPGGRLGLSDMVAEPERLPPELLSVQGWVACVAGARPRKELAALLESAGLRVEESSPADDALLGLLDRVEARLRLATMLTDSVPQELRGWARQGLELTAAAREAVDADALGYAVLSAVKPA